MNKKIHTFESFLGIGGNITKKYSLLYINELLSDLKNLYSLDFKVIPIKLNSNVPDSKSGCLYDSTNKPIEYSYGVMGYGKGGATSGKKGVTNPDAYLIEFNDYFKPFSDKEKENLKSDNIDIVNKFLDDNANLFEENGIEVIRNLKQRTLPLKKLPHNVKLPKDRIMIECCEFILK